MVESKRRHSDAARLPDPTSKPIIAARHPPQTLLHKLLLHLHGQHTHDREHSMPSTQHIRSQQPQAMHAGGVGRQHGAQRVARALVGQAAAGHLAVAAIEDVEIEPAGEAGEHFLDFVEDLEDLGCVSAAVFLLNNGSSTLSPRVRRYWSPPSTMSPTTSPPPA